MYANANGGAGASAGPEENPVLRAYNDWAGRTPFVTRCIMITLAFSFILGLFVALDDKLSNNVHFTITQLEVYRVVTSGLYVTSLLSAVFGLMTFNSTGPRLEAALGSTGLMHLVLVIDVAGNLAFLALCSARVMMGDITARFASAAGFWNILMALNAIECMGAPEQPRKFMFFPCSLPSKFHPLMLYGLFCLFGGFRLDMGVYLALGYAYGAGKLDRLLKPPRARLEGWEAGCLSNLVMRQGYISGGAAMGQDAWVPVNAPEGRAPSGGGGGGGGLASFFGGGQQQQQQQQQQPGQGGGGAGGESGWVSSSGGAITGIRGADKKGAAGAATFAGSGHTLGGTGGGGASVLRRQAAPDAEATRAARLAALERGGGGGAMAAASAPPPAGVDHEVMVLQEMGYPAEAARQALNRSGGDINAAVVYLASG